MSSLVSVSPAPSGADQPEELPYSRWRVALGVLGRSWLWFLVGCLLVTLVPMLFGWRPFLIESGSMEPRISVGDVVLAAPTDVSDQDLVGHVIVFRDPDFAGRVKTHRAMALAEDDAGLVTKGDANPTDDSMSVPRDHVIGLGRLLVQYVGLPVIWMHNGEWFYLALFLLSVLLASWAVNRDREDEAEPDDPDGGGPDEPAQLVPRSPRTDGGTQIAAATKPPLLRWRGGAAVHPAVQQLAVRIAILGAMCLALLAPTTAAAFAATTNNGSSSWSVPNWSYTTEVNNLGPYLYWKLDETHAATTGGSTATAADSSGNGRTGQYNPNSTTTNFTTLADGALVTDTPDIAVQLNTDNSCINTTSTTLINSQSPVSVVIWFKAAANYATGGKLAGFEKPRTGVAVPSTGTYDRHLYMDGNGRIWFGVYNNGYVTIGSSVADLADGNWHMAVGTVGPAGTFLYIDGALSASNTGNTAAEATTGVWRAGCGNLAGWGGSWGGGNNPTTDSGTAQNRPFKGSLDEFSVHASQLTAAQISFLYWIR